MQGASIGDFLLGGPISSFDWKDSGGVSYTADFVLGEILADCDPVAPSGSLVQNCRSRRGKLSPMSTR